jgi:hypothetical protein
MKQVTEYLENAVQFERLAAAEKDSKLRAELEQQAAAYHKLAAQRAKQLGVALPKSSWSALDDFQLKNGLQVRTVAKIAEALGRDIEDVQERIRTLGLKLGPHN